MKQGSNTRRSRSRGNGRRNGGAPRNSVYDSNGPDCRVRGSAQQVLDKYLQLGRDAHAAGDRVAAEAYFQFAEHYYRILNANNGDDRASRSDRGGQNTPADQGSADHGGDASYEEEASADGRAASADDDAGASGGDENAGHAPATKPRGRPRTRSTTARGGTRKSPAKKAASDEAAAHDSGDGESGAATAETGAGEVKEIPIKPTRRGRRKKAADTDGEAAQNATAPNGEQDKEQISA